MKKKQPGINYAEKELYCKLSILAPNPLYSKNHKEILT